MMKQLVKSYGLIQECEDLIKVLLWQSFEWFGQPRELERCLRKFNISITYENWK